MSVQAGYVVNCLITGNKTNGSDNNANYGGGIDVSFSGTGNPVYIINCTVADNEVTGRGGGIGGKTSTNVVQIENCIFYNNTARTSLADTNNVGIGGVDCTIAYSLWPEAIEADGNLKGDI